MDSKPLLQARNYEELYGERISPDDRPLFHVTPKIGWMNDPNGFSYYNGEYHLFYQYHPYNTKWGPMHWGHVTTKDLIRWEWLPAALAPDAPYDGDGCYSGSALELPDGTHALMYTGVQKRKTDDGRTVSRQVQCMAYGDGTNYEKYENNPVLTAAHLPEGGSPEDFRDPKIWRDEEENCYYAVVGNEPADGSGSVLLFRSEDTRRWEFVTVLDECKHEYGIMWECPDFFQLDGRAVILVSPTEMLVRGMEFHNGHGTLYLVGDYDKKTHCFARKEAYAIDYGLDFYAPQTLLAPDGRRIMIGWMQSWESSNRQPHGTKWFGMMTIPRELRIVNGRLRQRPVRELEAYRSNPVCYRNVDLSEQIRLPGVCGRVLDMTVNLRPAGARLYESVTIKVAENMDCCTSITYDPNTGVLHFDRSHSGFRHDIVSTRNVLVGSQNGEIKLRIVMDRFSVEIFVNDGEQAVTSTIYTPQEAQGISFCARGTALLDVEKYELVPGMERRKL